MKKLSLFVALFVNVFLFAFAAGNISSADVPIGFAGVNYVAPRFGKENTFTVKNRAELMAALSKENRLIFIDGMIDLSDEGKGSLLPKEGDLNTKVSLVMDGWIKSHSDGAVSSYKAWVETYSATCAAETDDGSSKSKSNSSSLHALLYKMHNAYKDIISIRPKSNTTIIGLGKNSGIRGGSIVLGNPTMTISNVVIRNINIVDAVDMFPKHETNDGYNSAYDGISIQSDCENIWIDHCTFRDTLEMDHVKTGGKIDEKWQMYDGDCDIKGSGKGITVSNCHFYKHDKTMLIGSADKEGDNKVRKISILANWFDTCVQRLPMVRNSQIHIANNYYTFDTKQNVNGRKSTFYAIGPRNGCLVFSEGNFFEKSIDYSYSGSESTAKNALVYSLDNTDNSKNKGRNFKSVKSFLELGWNPNDYYKYTAIPSTDVPNYVTTQSGAGVCEVKK